MTEREKTVLVLSAVFQLRNLQLMGYFSTKKTKVGRDALGIFLFPGGVEPL